MPGPQPHSVEVALEEALAEALEMVERMREQRDVAKRGIATWQSAADRARRQLAELRLAGQPKQLTLSASPTNQRRTRSAERFGKYVVPLTEHLIKERDGPISVDDIYAALPQNVRDELDLVPSAYPTTFRIRRMLRRNRQFIVTTAGVDLRRVARPKTETVTALVRRADGVLVGLEIDDQTGQRFATPADVSRAMEAGERFRLRLPDGRTSDLGLIGTEFYSHINGKENDDFFDMRTIPAENALSLTVEDAGYLSDE